MKRRLLLMIACTLGLGACATTLPATPTAYAVGDTVFEGWVRFSGEEFELNANRDQVLQPLGRPCVSGSLPRDLLRQARGDLHNQRVRITGRTQAWSEDLPGNRIDYAGVNIRNTCGAAFVILADQMAPIP